MVPAAHSIQLAHAADKTRASAVLEIRAVPRMLRRQPAQRSPGKPPGAKSMAPLGNL